MCLVDRDVDFRSGRAPNLTAAMTGQIKLTIIRSDIVETLVFSDRDDRRRQSYGQVSEAGLAAESWSPATHCGPVPQHGTDWKSSHGAREAECLECQCKAA